MAKTADEASQAALDPSLPQKKRARRRLVGAAAMCLAVAVALSILLDKEPRDAGRAGDDLKVEIPARDTPLPAPSVSGEVRPSGSPDTGGAAAMAAPSASTAANAAAGNAASDAAAAQSRAGASGAGAASAAPAGSATPAQAGAPSTQASRAARPEAVVPARQRAKPESPTQDAKAKPDAHPSAAKPPAARAGRYVLQVGAFASEKGASEQSARIRAAGQAAYTEKIKTANGERIRVRIGPFSSREQAEQARSQLKQAGIESALIAP